jgi:hypothetical protein
MKLRWHIVRDEWEQWDDRGDTYHTVKMESQPELQYFDNSKWVKVPTVITLNGEEDGNVAE